MAQPIVRKRPVGSGHAAQAPTYIIDRAESEENRQDSRWGSQPAGEKSSDDKTPTSCLGHFDRSDVEYTPKVVTRARVVVYHDSPIAGWSSSALLQHGGMPSQSLAAKTTSSFQQQDVVMNERESKVYLAESMHSVADDFVMSGALPTSRRPSMKYADPVDEEDPTTPHEAMQMLARLRVSDAAERIEKAEDSYYAGRLASTCVIMSRDGLFIEAKKLGRWSVDLVGEEAWDGVFDSYASAPRHDNDNWGWMAFLLAEVDIQLRLVDEGKAEELRIMVSQWEEMGILPTQEGLRILIVQWQETGFLPKPKADEKRKAVRK